MILRPDLRNASFGWWILKSQNQSFCHKIIPIAVPSATRPRQSRGFDWAGGVSGDREILSLGDSADVGEEERERKVRRLKNIIRNFNLRKYGRHASPGLTNFSQKLPLKRSVIETMFELSRRIFSWKKSANGVRELAPRFLAGFGWDSEVERAISRKICTALMLAPPYIKIRWKQIRGDSRTNIFADVILSISVIFFL